MVTISNEDYKELCKFVLHVYDKTRADEKVDRLWVEVSARRIWKMQDKNRAKRS